MHWNKDYKSKAMKGMRVLAKYKECKYCGHKEHK
jgi:hypothetical protein